MALINPHTITQLEENLRLITIFQLPPPIKTIITKKLLRKGPTAITIPQISSNRWR